MFGRNYYHGLVRKYVVIFGTLFNDIQITRTSNDGDEVQTFKVPLTFGPKEKFLARVEGDEELNRPYSIHLPRIAFQMTGLTYDQSRKTSTTLKFSTKNTEGQNKSVYRNVYVPVPYNLQFTMEVVSKTAEDGARIVEQILPFFSPDWTVSANLLEDFDNYTQDIKITLDDVQSDNQYEGQFQERQYITWTLNFTMYGYFYGPVTKAKQIKIAKVYAYTDIYATEPVAMVQVQPGLDANGNPTSLAANSIPVIDIEEDDNYGYVVTILEEPNL